MKKLVNPFGDKGGMAISDMISNVHISLLPGRSIEVPDNVAHQAKYIYGFLSIEDIEAPVHEVVEERNEDGKKKRRSFLNL